MTQNFDYTTLDLFYGDEAELTCHRKTMRTARKEHKCMGLCASDPPHTIKIGEQYLDESALVDREFWGNYRVCIPCLDRFANGDY